MTLKEFKAACKGRKLFVYCIWGIDKNNGEYFPVSAAGFLKAIGADVPYNRDGLCDETHVDARIDGNEVYVN